MNTHTGDPTPSQPFDRWHRMILRILSLVICLTLVASTLTSAGAASDFLVLMMSRNASGEEGNEQSDYASIAFGSDSMTDPFPPMVFSSTSTNLLDPSAPEAAGMVEDGQKQYDVFLHDEVTNETRLLSRTNNATGVDGESVLASVGVADRHLVVFQSSSTNLMHAADTNGKTDIYLVNLNTPDDDPILVSARTGEGVGGNNHSGNTLDNGMTWKDEGGTYTQIADWHKPAFAYTGYVDNNPRTFALFESKATNLVPTGTNGQTQIFRRDVYEQITTLVSKNKFAEQANDDVWQPSASTNAAQEGRFIVFVSDATNFIDLDGDGDIDATDCLNMADVDGDGTPDDSDLTNPRDINGDGKIDAADDTKAASNIYMLDTSENEVILISRQWNCNGVTCAPGAQANGPSSYPSFSQDGRYIAFQSKADNLVSVDNYGYTDIFLYDTQNNTDRLRIISVSSNIPSEEEGQPDLPGVQANMPSYSPVVVSNGDASAQIAVFTSYADNLIDGDANLYCNYTMEGTYTQNCPDIYVHDFNRGQTWRVSLAADGLEGQGSSGWPTLSGNGRFVYFTSISRLLGDGEYVARRQVYLRDQGNPPGNPNLQPTSYIFPFVEAGGATTNPTRRFRISALASITILNVRLETGTDFVLLEDDCSNFGEGRTLNDGDECTFVVEFTPHNTGRSSDRVLIDLHDTNPGMRDRTITARVSGTSTFFYYLPMMFGNGK
ncbi:MAG TPA: hypothetical protein VIO36_07725 [Anaerolineaceae bacterium]